MAKAVFCNVPLYGHANLTFPIVQELVARGEQVSYYLTDTFKSQIEATGATFRPYETSLFKGGPMNGPGGQQAALPLMMADETLQLVPQVIEQIRAEQPDYLVYDVMCLWARVVAQQLGIPAISTRPSYAVNAESFGRMAQSLGSLPFRPPMGGAPSPAMARLHDEYGLPVDMPSVLSHAEPLNIVTIPRAFQPNAELFDERYAFVGPCIAPRTEPASFHAGRLGQHGQPVLLISLGTVFNNQLAFFRSCFEAFSDSNWQVVLAYGQHIDPAALGPAPDNFITAPYVPQLEVLQHADLFVSHGGMNSTMEALYYGVPLVVIPQMFEQAMTARRVAELGLGVALDPAEVTAEGMRAAVGQVAGDADYAARVQAMQAEVRAAGGYQRAAEAILEFRRGLKSGSGHAS